MFKLFVDTTEYSDFAMFTLKNTLITTIYCNKIYRWLSWVLYLVMGTHTTAINLMNWLCFIWISYIWMGMSVNGFKINFFSTELQSKMPAYSLYQMVGIAVRVIFQSKF